MSDQERILTEEELKVYEVAATDCSWAFDPYAAIKLINSHRCLMDANAALSFKNMELQTDLTAAKGNALLWRDKATIHQRSIEELQRELAAEKAASEFWRRKLHKALKGVETE